MHVRARHQVVEHGSDLIETVLQEHVLAPSGATAQLLANDSQKSAVQSFRKMTWSSEMTFEKINLPGPLATRAMLQTPETEFPPENAN